MFLVFRIGAVMGDGMSPWCLSFSSRGVWFVDFWRATRIWEVPGSYGSRDFSIFWLRVKIEPSFGGAPPGCSSVYHHFHTNSSFAPQLTMAKCRCYYRADGRPIPPKVGPGALIGPIGIDWCESYFFSTASEPRIGCRLQIWPLFSEKRNNAPAPSTITDL